MAEKKKKSSALARLVDSIEIKNADGSITNVPVSAEDNSTANKILASQMRSLIQKHIEKMGGLDVMTPKELKEMTEAAKNVAEFSGEVYKSGDVVEPKKVDGQSATVTDVIDFSSLTSRKPDDKKEDQQSPQETQEKGT